MRRDIYCTLILIHPRYSVATYLDSGSDAKTKNYAYTKGVLDDALEGYAKKGGDFTKGGKCQGRQTHVQAHNQVPLRQAAA